MSSQRPTWYRFPSRPVMRPPARPPPRPPPPPPTTSPARPPAPPANPSSPPPPPSQIQEPPPLPSSNPTPTTTSAPPQNSPVRTPAAPPRSPAAPPPRSPIAPPTPQPSPPQIDAPTPNKSAPTPSNSPLHSKTALRTTPTNSQHSSPKPPPSPVPRPLPTTPIPSPKLAKPNSENNPSQSPTIKPLPHPPSPLTLPPPQIEADGEGEAEPIVEQKSVLVQETKPTKIQHKSPHNYNNTGVDSKDHKVANKKLSDSEKFGVRVITLAGENKGAVMELIPNSHKKNNAKNTSVAKVGGSNNGHQLGSSDSGEEGKPKNKENDDKRTTGRQPQPMTGFGFFNSNVQGVNNSILYNASCQHNDPGIHLSLTRKPNGDRKHHG